MTLQTPTSPPAPNMNVFAPHGAVHAPGPHHYCLYNQPYNPPPCLRCAPDPHPTCQYRCPANPRAPELTYTFPPACPCRHTGAPLTVNVNGPVLNPFINCGGGPHAARPHLQLPNRLFLNPEAMARPVCPGGCGGGVPVHACGQRAPNRFVRGF